MLPNFIFTFVDDKYNQVFKILNEELKNAESDVTKEVIFKDFSEKYLMQKSLWTERLRIQPKNMAVHKFSKLYQDATYHFFYDNKYLEPNQFRKKLMKELFAIFPFGGSSQLLSKEHQNMVKIEECLTFPHDRLRQCFLWYEQNSASLICPKFTKNIDILEEMYGKIKDAEGDSENWLDCLKSVKDFEFVKCNVEHRIAENLNDKNLWKIYIHYLRNNNPQEMLQVYSKYCRFFLDDVSMKEEYMREVEKYGPVNVLWKNPFYFETPIENKKIDQNKTVIPDIKSMEIVEEKMRGKVTIKHSFLYEYSQNQKTFQQRWSMTNVIMQYVIEHAVPTIYYKLQQTSKYFFCKKPRLYCYKFMFIDYESNPLLQFKEQSLLLTPKTVKNLSKVLKPKNLVLAMSLSFEDYTNHSILSNILNTYVYKCYVKHIEIRNQNITEIDLKFLCSSGNVETFKVQNTTISDSTGGLIMLENILILLPKVRIFDLTVGHDSILSTANYLSDLKFEKKFFSFFITQVSNHIDTSDFCCFVKKNAAPYSYFHIGFKNSSLRSELYIAMEEMINQWKPYEERPKFFDQNNSSKRRKL